MNRCHMTPMSPTFSFSAPGESLEIAEKMAAHDALMTMYGIQDNRLPINFKITYQQRRGKHLTDSSRQSISAS